jgi:hypothetical protein
MGLFYHLIKGMEKMAGDSLDDKEGGKKRRTQCVCILPGQDE